MASTATNNTFECDYLHSHTSPIPLAFTSDQAELVHINERISSLDRHISHLNTLRCALHRRSRQLHNQLAQIHALPIEILSCIFQHLVSSRDDGYPNYKWYRKCLRRALALSSVSIYFREVALGTPELWKNIALYIPTRDTIGNASSLLRHCMALAGNVNISVLDELASERRARLAVEALLASDTAPKIKSFHLPASSHGLNVWIEKLKGSSFPMLETLDIDYHTKHQSFDFRTLKNLTRLHMSGPSLGDPSFVPPSVRYLDIGDISPQQLEPLLRQCPNLVECVANISHYYGDFWVRSVQFNEPLILSHLKRLTFRNDFTMTPSSEQNLQLPSLEYFQMDGYRDYAFSSFIPFCRDVSSTLTTLKIHTVLKTFENDFLYQLCGIPFPKLRKLKFYFHYWKPLVGAIRALTQRVDECCNTKTLFLPSLSALTLRTGHDVPNIAASRLLDLFEKWRIDKESCLHVKFKIPSTDLSPELLEELKSIVGSRQIEDDNWEE